MRYPKIEGRVAWIFSEPNFDIDLIVGVENIKGSDIETLKKACMKKYDLEFAARVKEGDVIVGGSNFGYGHPHYHACKALREFGIKAIIAESFSPGFYRAEVINGFPLIECNGVLEGLERWDLIAFDWEEGVLINKTRKKRLKTAPIPAKTRNLILHGGIIPYLQHERL